MQRVFPRLIAILIAAVSLSTPIARAEESQPARQVIRADSHWRFFLGDPTGAETPSFDDSHWRSVDLPHDWSIERTPEEKNPTGASGGYFQAGIGWYRKPFTAPASSKGKRGSIEFDVVARNATHYLQRHN